MSNDQVRLSKSLKEIFMKFVLTGVASKLEFWAVLDSAVSLPSPALWSGHSYRGPKWTPDQVSWWTLVKHGTSRDPTWVFFPFSFHSTFTIALFSVSAETSKGLLIVWFFFVGRIFVLYFIYSQGCWFLLIYSYLLFIILCMDFERYCLWLYLVMQANGCVITCLFHVYLIFSILISVFS